MGKSVIIKDCEISGCSLDAEYQIEESEKYIQHLKDTIRSLVMSTPREIKIEDSMLTWIEYAEIELNQVFEELENELMLLGKLYVVQSEIMYDKDNVIDNS